MPGQNDTDLPVAAARRGDSVAWQRLFDRYQRPIFVFIHELVQDREASLDLVQDTFCARFAISPLYATTIASAPGSSASRTNSALPGPAAPGEKPTWTIG